MVEKSALPSFVKPALIKSVNEVTVAYQLFKSSDVTYKVSRLAHKVPIRLLTSYFSVSVDDSNHLSKAVLPAVSLVISSNPKSRDNNLRSSDVKLSKSIKASSVFANLFKISYNVFENKIDLDNALSCEFAIYCHSSPIFAN